MKFWARRCANCGARLRILHPVKHPSKYNLVEYSHRDPRVCVAIVMANAEIGRLSRQAPTLRSIEDEIDPPVKSSVMNYVSPAGGYK